MMTRSELETELIRFSDDLFRISYLRNDAAYLLRSLRDSTYGRIGSLAETEWDRFSSEIQAAIIFYDLVRLRPDTGVPYFLPAGG